MSKLRWVITLVSCFVALCEHARADVVHLFERGSTQVDDYDSKIEQLKNQPQNQILEFTDFHHHIYRFQLVSFLGEGKTTAVFKAISLNDAAAREIALRVPIGIFIKQKGKDSPKEKTHAQQFINETLFTYQDLKENGVPIPQIFESSLGTFIATELVHPDFDGVDFFSHPEKINPQVLKEAQHALEEFTSKTFQYEMIGDFEPGQLVYNIKTRQWTLLDYTSFLHSKAGATSKSTIFDNFIFERGLTKDRGRSYGSEPQLTSREKELISHFRSIALKKRTFHFRMRCFFNSVMSKK